MCHFDDEAQHFQETIPPGMGAVGNPTDQHELVDGAHHDTIQSEINLGQLEEVQHKPITLMTELGRFPPTFHLE